MRFEWDPEKERLNRTRHGLDFSWAALIFADPKRAILYDRFEGGEDRWHAIGAVAGGLRVLLAVHAYPDEADLDRVRVISLRKATSLERHRYYAEDA